MACSVCSVAMEPGGGAIQPPRNSVFHISYPQTEHTYPPLSGQGGCLVYCLIESATLQFPHLLLVIAFLLCVACFACVSTFTKM